MNFVYSLSQKVIREMTRERFLQPNCVLFLELFRMHALHDLCPGSVAMKVESVPLCS